MKVRTIQPGGGCDDPAPVRTKVAARCALLADLHRRLQADGVLSPRVPLDVDYRAYKWGGKCEYRGHHCPVTGRAIVKSVTIKMSAKWMAVASVEDVVHTYLHEVAHAIAGHDAGHGPWWAEWCERLGIEAHERTDVHCPDVMTQLLSLTAQDLK